MGESSRPAPKKTDFGSDLSKGFGADRRPRDAQPRRDSDDRSARRPDQDRTSRDRVEQERPTPPRNYGDSPQARPWQDRGTSDRPTSRSAAPARPSDDRPERSSDRPERAPWRDKPSTDRRPSTDRPTSWSDREEPRFERREPDRGSRVREDEIGERWPEIPEWADPRELDAEVRRDLRGLSKEGAEFVGAHLFMAGMLAEEEPALAWRHARAARSKGGRIAVVRETVGLVAYHAGEWAEAIAELRAARRMSGGPGQLPVMADCERALGHPEKAIELSRSAEASELDPASAAELRIVVAGARADLGQLDAALAHLELALQVEKVEPFTARLFYAYADLLLQADRRAEAIDWFMKAAEIDVDEETDAGERLTELAGGVEGAEIDVDAGEDDDDSAGDAGDADENADDPDDQDTGSGLLAFDDDPDVDTVDISAIDGDVDADDAARVDHVEDAAEGGVSNATVGAGSTDTEALEVDPVDARPSMSADTVAGPDTNLTADTDADTGTDIAEDDNRTTGAEASEQAPPPETLPKRPASPPSSLGSLFSHNEAGL